MGCSAGKSLSTSPEVSTSTQHTSLHGANNRIDNRNGLSNYGFVDEKRSKTISSPKASANSPIRKDSTSSTASSNSLDTTDKCLDILPNNRPPKQEQEQSKLKEDNGQQRELVHNKSRSNDEQPLRSIPLGQVKVKLTQSQADFFTMLDMKIEEGEDYKSDCER